jgi:hypothetical protein
MEEIDSKSAPNYWSVFYDEDIFYIPGLGVSMGGDERFWWRVVDSDFNNPL